jgi:hypothetical protein|tara:strand:+ start:946 stop:1089 length:144 start_codon:yes stop_codon:yes gene_type:complete
MARVIKKTTKGRSANHRPTKPDGLIKAEIARGCGKVMDNRRKVTKYY